MDSLQNKCWALGAAFPLPFFPLSHKLAMTFQTDNVGTSILFFSAPVACMNNRQRLTKVRMGCRLEAQPFNIFLDAQNF